MAKRRGNREGTIYQDKDGRWRAAIDLGIVNGRRKRKVLSDATRREVADKLARALRDQQEGALVTDERQTVRQYIAHWLETCKDMVRPATYDSYEYMTRIWIVPRLGHLRLAKLSAQHVQAFITEINGTDISPKTVRHIHGTLRAALNHAVRLGVIRQNVALLVDLPKARRYLVQPWTAEQIGQFLAAARGDRFEAAYYVALGAGLREGEILGMTWSLVDLDGGTARVTQKVERVRGHGLRLSRPKGDAGEATVTLPAIVVQKLRTHRTTQMRERLMAGGTWPGEAELRRRLVEDQALPEQYRADLIFTSRAGTAVDPVKLYRRFQAIREAAGLPPHRFHDLRHDHASFMLSLGVSLKEIQASLRHSQIGLTADTYTHLLAAVSAANAAKMDGLLRGAAGEA